MMIRPMMDTHQVAAQNVQHKSEMYDLDVEFRSAQPGSVGNNNQLITSHSLCTPGCGHTGTGNSFCC